MKESDEMRYDELFELSHNDLVVKFIELENAITANNDYMQELFKQIEDLTIENKAMSGEIGKQTDPRRGHFNLALGIGKPEFYFSAYKHQTKEQVLMQLMSLDKDLYRKGIISSPTVPLV